MDLLANWRWCAQAERLQDGKSALHTAMADLLWLQKQQVVELGFELSEAGKTAQLDKSPNASTKESEPNTGPTRLESPPTPKPRPTEALPGTPSTPSGCILV